MSEQFETCIYCERADECVEEFVATKRFGVTVISKTRFDAHRMCLLKEMSTSGDGQGVRPTA